MAWRTPLGSLARMSTHSVPSRRTFLASGAATLALATTSRLAAGTPPERDPAVVELVRGLVAANDDRIPGLLARQERRPGHRWLGGMLNEYGLHTPHGAQGLIIPLVAAACAPGGRYFGAPELDETLRHAIRANLSAQ